MTSVSSVTSASNTAASSNAVAGGLVSTDPAATQDRFLKLLVAQIRNQDPLNPLQNSEVTSQLAQLSTVTGINNLSQIVSGLSSSFNEAQSLQAASIIGHGVIVPGQTLPLANGAAQAAVDLPQNLDQLTINIRNASGAIVHTANLGAQSSGLVRFAWDGKDDNGNALPSGLYSFDAKGISDGKAVSGLTPYAYGQVSSVTLGDQGAVLNVDGLGAIKLSQVKQIV